ncbi:MAG: hypothetical protein DWQ02_18530 [Bacteroidetes bacterium]|nr:MAG: hypothetical protein DWQ02_18530 [Bacteroidota bacterium]
MKKLLLSISCCILIVSLCSAQEKGTITFQIMDLDTEELIPARLVILQNGAPFNHGIESDLRFACRDNTIYTADGTGTFEIVPGTYEFWFGRGMEYNVDIHNLTIEGGQTYSVKAKLKRELDTRGMVCGDMHLHTLTNSGHGDASIEERVISCAAEGLEWAVATDHNYLTDYIPYLKKTGLEGKMATTVSNEVSTQIGHFNTYPLEAGSEVADHNIKDGQELFDHLRAIAPKPITVQINHPRWSSTDFFNINELEPWFGNITGDKWSWDFDAIEVLNENYQLGWIKAPDNKYSVKRDWFNMLNQNKRICGVGNSDSHTVTASIAAVPRNYIASSTDEISEIDEAELSENVRKGKVNVACGLLTEIKANGNFGPGSTVYSNSKPVKLQLKVQAASWVSCNKAELIRNGVVEQTFEIPKSTNPVRLDTFIQINPEKDSWYLLIAYGDEPMFPMVGTEEKAINPLGFTNPIWIDADGDEKITSIKDQSLNTIADLEQNVNSYLTWFKQKPEAIPFAFNHWFTEDMTFAINLSKTYLEAAEIDQQLMLFQELSKVNHKRAKKLLKDWQKRENIPLIEVSLEKTILFPESDNRFQQFKKKEEIYLDEVLNSLEKQFAFIHSGATTKTIEIQYEHPESKDDKWHTLKMNKNGFFYPGKHPAVKKANKAILRTTVYARKTGMITCYLKTNRKASTKTQGIMGTTITNPNMSEGFELSEITVIVQKGLNTIEIQMENLEGSVISFLPVESKLLLDPEEKFTEVNHLAKDKTVTYLTQYSDKYHGHGIALTDGLKSSTNWHNQLWQGWTGQPMEVIIDLGKKQKVSQITLSTLADQGSWIFFPKKIQFFVSFNGTDYHQVSEIKVSAERKLAQAQTKDFTNSFLPLKVRYIKVVAAPIDVLPEWHSASGNKGAWIFVDEIIVE